MADLAKFDLPVDSEHKATKVKLFSFAAPHMRAFHVNWMCFFTCFLSTFAPAALVPIIRDVLDLNKEDLTNAGIAAVSGTIGARIFMGSLCDMVGPRLSMGITLLLTAAPTFGMSLVKDRIDFIMVRFGIGFGLAAFVACQYWTSAMYNVRIVGSANAIAAGWGNMGGGVTHLLMPFIYTGIAAYVPDYEAWRWAFYVPGFLHIIFGAMCLLITQDLPDGNFDVLQKAGTMKADSGMKIFLNALTNYRMIIGMILYACCFGVELTMDNILTYYLYDQFDLKLTIAGLFGGLFGLMNLFSRALGGIVSDWAAKKYGMRGRLHVLFHSIFWGGVFCILMALCKNSLLWTILMMLIFSIFCQSACGTSYAVVPFISKRSLCVVSGFIGAGGNLGSVFTQFVFFTKESIPVYDGILYTGIFIICGSLTTALYYFPMWGSMLTGPREGATEEDYYMAEYTAEERASGLADAAMKFANESKSQRGVKAGLEGADLNKSDGAKVASS